VLAFPELVASLKIVDDTGHVHKPERHLVAASPRPLKSVVLEEALSQIRLDIRVEAQGLGLFLWRWPSLTSWTTASGRSSNRRA
jgi:hypothetical protein